LVWWLALSWAHGCAFGPYTPFALPVIGGLAIDVSFFHGNQHKAAAAGHLCAAEHKCNFYAKTGSSPYAASADSYHFK
jgi:hypothetical protein